MTSEQNGCFVTIGSGPAEAEKPVRILIVEDDFFVATDLEQTLQQEGFETVGIATTAEEAIRLAEATKPHLAIMDIRLAGRRDGIDAAIELQERYGIPSVFASAHGDDIGMRKRAEKARPAGWLTKPYSTRLAVATVRRVLPPTSSAEQAETPDT
jgi:DNA-binding NarL/FixJ family response regulator